MRRRVRPSCFLVPIILSLIATTFAQSPPPVSFQAAVNYAAGSNPWSVAVGDFNGDGKPDLAVANYGSNSVSVLLNSLVSTTTTLISSTNPSTVGQSVVFTATIAPSSGTGTPTGTVTFKDGATTLGTGTLNGSGQATYTTSSLTAGTHSITAVYGGDSQFEASTSAAVSQVVNQATTSTTLASSLNPSVFGQSVTFTAAVTSSAGVPTGTVTFKDGATTLGTGTVNNSGQATLATAALSGGPHTITAAYGGDTNFATSTSSAVAQTVGNATTMTTLNSSPNPSTFGQTVNFVATVVGQYGGAATGTVTFKKGTKVLGTASLVNGVATLPLSTLGTGSHTVTAVYGGDANSNGSTSSAITQNVVAKTATTTTLSSSLNPSFVGQLVTFTATVTPSGAGTPTGSVTFKQGSTTLGSAPVTNGQAAYTTTYTTAGTRQITAIYSGDNNNLGSTSPILKQVVNKVLTTTTTLTSSQNPSTFEQMVIFTATVSSSQGTPPDGETVTFKQGATVLGTGALSGGVASFSTSSLNAGTLTITAVYSGDATLATSSGTVKQTVKKAGATPLANLLTACYTAATGCPYQGGLYGTTHSTGGTNTPPSTYNADGISIANSIAPLDTSGNVCSSGSTCKIVIASIGMSIAHTVWSSFVTASNNDTSCAGVKCTNSFVTFVNGAYSGQDAPCWINATGLPICYQPANNLNEYDRVIANMSSGQGFTNLQVQVVWIEDTNGRGHNTPAGGYGSYCNYLSSSGGTTNGIPCIPLDTSSASNNSTSTTEALNYQLQLGMILRAAKTRFPNLKMAFFSGRNYGGYAGPNTADPEPYAYEKSFSYKWAIMGQIAEVATGTADPVTGSICYKAGTCTVNAPWIGWSGICGDTASTCGGTVSSAIPAGSWADGTSARGTDGLYWCHGQSAAPCNGADDFVSDGTHFTASGNTKAANSLLNFFLTSPYAAPWFHK